jgi:carboxyl-terminal processing protease
MLDNQTGYIKLVRFSSLTKSEFYSAIVDMKFSGIQNLILDLRGNTGGYLQTATELADEFIPKGYLLVYTEGVNHPRTNYESTSSGEFEKGRLVDLIEENSASASEILAGAIQDCDRGLIIGRRSYGKGLVQRPYYLPDGSAIRLTTARYYTPSGRLLQKPYKDGVENYFKDLSLRFGKGEYISADSIKFPDSLRFYTYNKRTVYGGGGIMPDIFIPLDTSHNIPWYKSISSANLPYSFAVKYVDDNRENLTRNYPYFKLFEKNFIIVPEILDSFMVYCSANNQSADTVDVSGITDRLPVVIKAHIAALLFDNTHYLKIAASLDETLMQSLRIINDKSYFRRNNIEF